MVPDALNIVIYESGSRGGNFDYSKSLFRAYRNDARVSSVQWIIPETADVDTESGVLKILCDDRRNYRSALASRLGFLYRTFINPLILYRFLRSCREKHYVILNDFEQLSAWVWAPLYSMFLSRHAFIIVLHDPDRDAYPPSRWFSSFSMKIIMKRMKLALYHEHLPDKPYYRGGSARYVSVVHGHYPRETPDKAMLSLLDGATQSGGIISIIGNIRAEKNYEMAIRALSQFPQATLVIAGAISSSGVNLDELRALAQAEAVSNRVLFIPRYLSPNEMSAVIDRSSVIVLNYKRTFASQSGILNLIAPFRKNVVISDTESALTRTARHFGLGYLVRPDDQQDFHRILTIALAEPANNQRAAWDAYLGYASWENHVNIVLSAIGESRV